MAIKLPDPATALGERPTPRPMGGVVSLNVGSGEAAAANAMQAARSVGQTGASIMQTGDEMWRETDRVAKIEQAKFDQTKAQEAIDKAIIKKLDLSTGPEGFGSQKGEAVTDPKFLKNWNDRFSASAKEIEDSLGNDEQKRQYRMHLRPVSQQYQASLYSHTSTEAATYKLGVFKGTVATAVRDATANWSDPNAVATAIIRSDNAADRMAEDNGWAKEMTEAQKQDARGKIHSSVIGQALASGNWIYAKNWYEEHKADVDAPTAKALERAVEDAVQKQLSAGYTADFLANQKNGKALGSLQDRVMADKELDETRKNVLVGRIQSQRMQLDAQAERAYQRQVRTVERVINTLNANTMAGYEPSLEQLQPVLAAAKGTELEGQAREMVALSDATRRFRMSGPQAQEATITQLETEVRKTPGKIDIKWLGAFKEIYKSQQAAVREDPTTFAVRQGLVPADAEAAKPLDLTKPDTMGQQLAARVSLARSMSREYGVPVKPLTKEETDLVTAFVSRATVNQKREYFGGLARSMGSDGEGYRSIMGQLAPDDPVTAIGGAYAGRGYQHKEGEIVIGRGTEVSNLIFRGQSLLRPNRKEDGSPDKGKLWPMPEGDGEKQMRQRFADAEREAFAGLGEARSGYFQTARAIYAALSEDAGDSKGVYDSSRWDKSIRLATGGFSDYNAKRVVLPYGHDGSSFKDGVRARINAIDPQQLSVTPEKLRDLPLQVSGDGRYVFRSGDSVLLDKSGRPVVIDFNRPIPFRTSGIKPPDADPAAPEAFVPSGESDFQREGRRRSKKADK